MGEARAITNSTRANTMITARVARAQRSIARIPMAAARRDNERLLQLDRYFTSESKREAAGNKRRGPMAAANKRRHMKWTQAIAHRTIQDAIRMSRGQVFSERVGASTDRHASVISSRVARAQLSAIKRSVPVML